MKVFSLKRIKYLPRVLKFKTALFSSLVFAFLKFTTFYFHRKIILLATAFESIKNRIVKFFIMKRGRYNRPFLHLIAMSVMGVGVLLAPVLAETYPIFSPQTPLASDITLANAEESITVGEDVFQTKISQKPRDKTITYRVEKGDTVSTIAEKFGISADTIKWANDLTNDNISVGDELTILPVTGISHKVASGDTVYTIAKKYDTEAQKIVDFPFNDFANPETFSLVVGQIVVVPDGVQPQAQPTYKRPVYLATGPAKVSNSGFYWPVQGVVSQFAAWYHMALDITSPIGTPIVAAQNGTVTKTNVGTWDGGYGTNIMIDDGNGNSTLYAHMSGINVSLGSSVVAGQTVVGWVGMTGRTTGPHVHFEIRKGGGLVNPMSYLQ